jgi:acyl-CoA dehydrogenase
VTTVAVASAVVETTRRVAETIVAPAADRVDREASFPREAIDALREEGLLGALVPRELGGLGASLTEVAAACHILGRACASTAMIFAMHQIEVACLVRHGLGSPYLRAYLSELAARGLLIASATSELGVGGDLRRSVCAVETDAGRFHIVKRAPVISYGEQADDILLTARRGADAAPGDQVLILARRADTMLKPAGAWDTLGMRGTCSLGFTLEATGSLDQILPEPFADIAMRTMVPVSHILWTSIWSGLATDATNRARACVRAEARKTAGTIPPSAQRLAEVVAELGTLTATVHDGLDAYLRAQDDPTTLASLGFAIRMNNLKTAASRLAPEIISRALSVTGLAGYRNDSPYSVGRHLRDALGASLMIANDRIFAATGAMLLLHKEDLDQ